MNNGDILIERHENIAVVTIDRQPKMNSFDEELFFKLGEAADRIRSDLPRAVILTGAGDRSFSSGFDVNPENPMVKRIIDAASAKDIAPAQELISAIRKAVDSFVTLPVPVIAAMNGSAYGGGAELAMRCDIRIADPDAVICFSETKLGLMPDWGGGAALVNVAGPSIAADLILTGRKVSAAEAYSLGIINRVSSKGKALEDARSVAEMISSNGPLAVRYALNLIRKSMNMTLDETLDMESSLAASLISSGECFHGVGAFIQKKKPVFPDVK